MKYAIKSLLSADRASLSSKRLCGFIGWLCCSAVLGLDSVTGIWKTDANENNSKTQSK